MRRFAIWALLILAACGEVKNEEPKADANVEPPVDTNDGIKSGTRLKVRWADFDGIKSFVSLFDSTRNEACSPRRFADGKTYCVPPAANVAFSDANCTMPIGVQSRSCNVAQTTYYVETDPLTCDNLPKKIYSRGAAISLSAYYSLSPQGCNRTVPLLSDLYSLGAEIPLTELATLVEEPISATPGRIQQRFFTSGDGARVFSSTYDTQLEAEAYLSLDASRGSARGVPMAVSDSGPGLFGDAACSQSRIASRRGCPVPKYISRVGLGCNSGGTVPNIFKVGVQANPSSLFNRTGGTCMMQDPDTTQNYYEVSSEMQTLGTFTRSPVAEGTGRFRKIYNSDQTSKVLDPSLFDTLRQTECAATTLKDGSIRCLPINIYSMTTYFSDSACTTPVPVVVVPNNASPGCNLPPLPKYTTRKDSMTCELDVRMLGQPVAGTLYTNQPGVCQAAVLTTTTPYSVTQASLEDFTAATVANE
jgi:hypothetical protein